MALERATSLEEIRSSLQVFADALADWRGAQAAGAGAHAECCRDARTVPAGLVELRQRMLS